MSPPQVRVCPTSFSAARKARAVSLHVGGKKQPIGKLEQAAVVAGFYALSVATMARSKGT
jgi:hypothetical protein